MEKKQIYESPETERIFVHFEESILSNTGESYDEQKVDPDEWM